jgi:hypothetical protein
VCVCVCACVCTCVCLCVRACVAYLAPGLLLLNEGAIQIGHHGTEVFQRAARQLSTCNILIQRLLSDAFGVGSHEKHGLAGQGLVLLERNGL